MNRTLFERLRAPRREHRQRPGRHRPWDHSADPDLVRSILHNLQRVLESRQGHSKACPDYGLFDLADIVYDMPEAEEAAAQAVRRCIEAYEPRLTRIRVVRSLDEVGPLTLAFRITARLAGQERDGDIMFDTEVSYSGRVRVVDR